MPIAPDHMLGLADWTHSALTSVGIATVVTDADGRVQSMNATAESLTGWTQADAVGRQLADIFRVENESTRQPASDPVARVLVAGTAVGLTDEIVLVDRDGRRWRIDHGAAPIRDEAGAVVGAVLIFCDVGERLRVVQGVEDARAFAEGIVQTVRQPLVVLDAALSVRTANRAFYATFGPSRGGVDGQPFFHLGGERWDIPPLRELLEQVLPRDTHSSELLVAVDLPDRGRRSVVVNACRLPPAGQRPALILLALEDETDRRQAAAVLAESEARYRRLFETAQDGILLVDPNTRRVFDANPFLTALLGYTHAELVGRELWQIGLFRDIESNKAAFRTLREKGYIRYDDLPLRTHDGRGIEVEFVSNVYAVGDSPVIQCNIRDVTDRKRAEEAVRAAHAQLEVRVRERTAELADTNRSLQSEIARREEAEAGRRDLQQQLTTVQEEERRRIARELHDQLGQHLTALALGLKVIEGNFLAPGPPRERLHQLQSLTDQIGREIHTLALELRPTALDDLGLPAALGNYIEAWAERTGVEADFHCSGLGDDRLPPPVETVLYRVVQEALTNVLKHAAARRVSVVVRRSPDDVSAVVEDDGRGFDEEAVGRQRLGILGMRERAAMMGGTLVVESAPQSGTTVIARIPLAGEPRRVET